MVQRNILFEERPFAFVQPGGFSVAKVTKAERGVVKRKRKKKKGKKK